MNIVKIYNADDETPSFIITKDSTIDSTSYINLFDVCKEEIYIDEELINTKYHKK
jgi:hypothetical protein